MNGITFSIILPSRGRADLFRHCCESIFFKARFKQNIEVICRIDDDEPQIFDYAKVAQDFRQHHNCRVLLIVGPRMKGYASNHIMIEEAATMSCGDFIIQFNDDMEYDTEFWDLEYIREAQAYPDNILVLTSSVSTPLEGKGKGYRYSAPVVTRRLYELCGEYSLGQDPSVDRTWDALMRNINREIHVKTVSVNHNHVGTLHPDQTANEGCNPFYGELCQNLAERWARHDEIGRVYAEKIRSQVSL